MLLDVSVRGFQQTMCTLRKNDSPWMYVVVAVAVVVCGFFILETTRKYDEMKTQGAEFRSV